jgi:adenine-specific DNA-methyltransferase
MAKEKSKKRPSTRMTKVKTPLSKKAIESYVHKDQKRLNNPPVGLVDAHSDNGGLKKRQYQYDPHLDPQLQWAGKAERTNFEVPTVSLHVHERIDPKRIIESIRKAPDDNGQISLFETKRMPLREAIEFYRHKENWSNRLIAGDSLLVMNSLLEKEGMGGKVQMVYCDPPYGIKYGSNFQPFVNRRNVKDGKDEDLTAEPEMIKAFRDTWELGIHSYLSYMRDRLLLTRELLHETGSVFVQISDENVHFVRNILDEVFGSDNFLSIICFSKAAGGLRAVNRVGSVLDYIIWYAKDSENVKYRPLFEKKSDAFESGYTMVEERNGNRRPMTEQESTKAIPLSEGARPFMTVLMTKPGPGSKFEIAYGGRKYDSGNRWWGTTPEGIQNVIKANRFVATESSIRFISYFDDFPYRALTNLWSGFGGAANPVYVVQTNKEIIQRCLLMTSDPGDLVLDITCGSGTTANVAEKWGRRWITCDTSRVAVTLAKQGLITDNFDYFELAHPNEGVGSGFSYKSVSHLTMKCIANIEPASQEILYDQPLIDNKRMRVTGPFTVEAVPAPVVRSFEDVEDNTPDDADSSVTRSGETLRQSEWREELFRAGVRAKGGKLIRFSRVEPMVGTRYLQAEAETKVERDSKNLFAKEDPTIFQQVQRVVICFGPEHAPLEQRTVELALDEAEHMKPKPQMVLFCAFQFDEEAAKDIDETKWHGVTLLKAQMNTDLQTDDLRKKRSSNESFWLIGQPEVRMEEIKKGGAKGKYKVKVLGFDYYNPQNGTVESGGEGDIAMWMLDTDYDGRSLLPSQVFFPMAGAKDGWATLAKNLKAEIDEEKIEAFGGTESLPFTPGKRVAVKIIDARGIESLKIIPM